MKYRYQTAALIAWWRSSIHFYFTESVKAAPVPAAKYCTSVCSLYWSQSKILNDQITDRRRKDKSIWPPDWQGQQAHSLPEKLPHSAPEGSQPTIPPSPSRQFSSPCHWWARAACPDRLPAAGSWACRQPAPTSWSPLGSSPGQGRSSPSGYLPRKHTHTLYETHKTNTLLMRADSLPLSGPHLLHWLQWCTGRVSWRPWLHPRPWSRPRHLLTPSELGCSVSPEHTHTQERDTWQNKNVWEASPWRVR